MTWTSAFGKGSGWLLQKIVNGLALTKISPNVLTFLGLVINIVAACFFGFARVHNADKMFFYRRAGDHRRGHLRHGGWARGARKTNQVSVFGAFFDSVMDRYSDVAIFFGLLVYYARGNRLFYVGLVAFVMTACVMVSYTRARAEALIGTCKVGFMERPERIVLRDSGRAVQPLGSNGSGAVGAGAVLDYYRDPPHSLYVSGDGAAQTDAGCSGADGAIKKSREQVAAPLPCEADLEQMSCCDEVASPVGAA